MPRRPMSPSDEDGFSLVELLVAVIIMSVLSSMGMLVVGAVRERTARAALESDLRNAGALMEGYYAAAGAYPEEGEVDLPASPDVVIEIVVPGALDDGQRFCLEGTHAHVGGGTAVSAYDQAAGGLQRDSTC